jgi:hypothetical protein
MNKRFILGSSKVYKPLKLNLDEIILLSKKFILFEKSFDFKQLKKLKFRHFLFAIYFL